MLNLTLAPNYFKSATTATGSVADKTHPNVKDWYQVRSSLGYLNIILNAIPIKIAPHKTPGAARIIIFNKDFLNTYQSQLKAKFNFIVYLTRRSIQEWKSKESCEDLAFKWC